MKGTAMKGGSIKVQKSQKSSAFDVNILREALFDSDGKDKDVTKTIAPAFMKFDRNGLDLVFSYSPKLSDGELDWAFSIVKSNMEEIYDKSGYGWDDDDKNRELFENGARFILVRERESNRLVAFTHFRFTVQGEVMDIMAGEPSMHIWDIHVEEGFQRRGLGKHLLMLLELIARQQKMRVMSIPVQLHDTRSLSWITKIRGFAPDVSLQSLVGFDSELEGFDVYVKVLSAPAAKPAAGAVPSAVSKTLPATPSKKAVGKIGGTPPPAQPSPTSVAEAISESPLGVEMVEKEGSALSAPAQTGSAMPQDGENLSERFAMAAAADGASDEVTEGSWILSQTPLEDFDDEIADDEEGDEGAEPDRDSDSDGDLVIPLGDAMDRLKELYRAKHGEDPTEDIVTEWEATLVATLGSGAEVEEEDDEEEENDKVKSGRLADSQA